MRLFADRGMDGETGRWISELESESSFWERRAADAVVGVYRLEGIRPAKGAIAKGATWEIGVGCEEGEEVVRVGFVLGEGEESTVWE